MEKLWACPRCRASLQEEDALLLCPQDGLEYPLVEGIWRLLDPQRAPELEGFISGYRSQRAEEGWGIPQSPEYYLNLPFKDATGKHPDLWHLRAKHMSNMLAALEPLFGAGRHPLVVDAGAGNCWLSYRLAERGARPVAIDINDDPADGLGAAGIYREHADLEITTAQGELERLPLVAGSCDAVVINSSLHYTPNQGAALKEAWRALRAGGMLVVMDSPVYHDEAAGKRMIEEWRERYTGQQGRTPTPLPGKGYTTYDEVGQGLLAAGFEAGHIHLRKQHAGLGAVMRSLKLWVAPTGAARYRELATHPMWVAQKDVED